VKIPEISVDATLRHCRKLHRCEDPPISWT
jgi:hypothetical protein